MHLLRLGVPELDEYLLALRRFERIRFQCEQSRLGVQAARKTG